MAKKNLKDALDTSLRAAKDYIDAELAKKVDTKRSINFVSDHTSNWTSSAVMTNKTYLGGWHGTVPNGASDATGYLSFAANGSQSVDMIIDGDYYAKENKKVYHEGNKPTPADIGALSTAGGTITGKVDFTNSGRIATFGNAGTNVPHESIATQTNYIEIAAPANTSHNSKTGIIFHHCGTSTSALEYVNTDNYNGYFNFKSDESTWDVRINGNKVYHAGNKPSLEALGAASGKSTSATTAATAQWYRIATSVSGINRVFGTFTIEATVSGKHSITQIHAGTCYGQPPTLQQMSHVVYNATGISKARIVYTATYSGNYAYLEVYLPTATATAISVSMSDYYGWNLVTPSTVGSIPSGYSNKEITFVSNKIVSDIQGNVSGSSSSCTGNAATATTLATSRTLTVGNTGKSFNGSGNVSWSLSEIGAVSTTDFNNLFIGGTNLITLNHIQHYAGGNLTDTNSYYTVSGTKITSKNQPLGSIIPGWRIYTHGKFFKYTVSGFTDLATAQYYFKCFDSDGNEVQAQTNSNMTVTNGYFSKTFSNIPTTTAYFQIGIGTSTGTGNYWLDRLKLERGDKATDWSPAPEDAVTNANAVNGLSLWNGTQAQYDAITNKSATTIYIIS